MQVCCWQMLPLGPYCLSSSQLALQRKTKMPLVEYVQLVRRGKKHPGSYATDGGLFCADVE